jgi:hypothetical protein
MKELEALLEFANKAAAVGVTSLLILAILGLLWFIRSLLKERREDQKQNLDVIKSDAEAKKELSEAVRESTLQSRSTEKAITSFEATIQVLLRKL